MEMFVEISLILVVAALFAWIMLWLRQPLLLGYILAGILVGPLGFDWLHARDTIELLSQLGITALLFIVGLGLSPQVMREVGKAAFVTGIGQIVFTSTIGFLIVWKMGFEVVPAIYVAIALTFSSTIIVTKLLSDRKDTGTLYGKIAIGFLLVQDVAAVMALVFVTAFMQGEATFTFAGALLGKGILLALATYVVSALFLPRLTRFFASSQEFLFLFSVGWGVGLSALFHFFGFSLEIGALVAGVTLAASPYHYEISAKMKLLRDFFLVPFFVLLGAQLAFGSLSTIWIPALVLSIFVLIGNPLIVVALMGSLGYHRKTSFMAGLTVAQVSEFSLLIVLLGFRANHFSQEVLTLVTVVALITITGSVYLFRYADPLYRLLDKPLRWFEHARPKRERRTHESYETILFGCHRVGEDFLRWLQGHSSSFLVADFDPAVIHRLETAHVPCRYGDAADNEFLDELELKGVSLIISTIPDIETNLFILAKARKMNADVLVIAVAQGIEEAMLLYGEGAGYVVLPHFLGGNYASLLLEHHGINPRRFATERKRHLSHLMEQTKALASTGPESVH